MTRSDGASFGTAATDTNGLTPFFVATVGTFDICEVGVPVWWPSAPPTSCQSLTISATDDGKPIVSFDWTNDAVPLSCTTVATDELDGDHLLPVSGGVLLDLIHCEKLVAGTEYTVNGELQSVAGGVATPTGLTGKATFMASGASQDVIVSYSVPVGYRCASLVAFETVGPRGHHCGEPRGPCQSTGPVRVPAVSTHTTTTSGGKLANVGEQVQDRVDYCGFAPGDYVFTAVWQHAATASGSQTAQCLPLNMVGTATAHVALGAPSGSVLTSPVLIPDDETSTFVEYETVTQAGTKIAEHAACSDLDQTVWRPTLQTQRAEADPSVRNPTATSSTSLGSRLLRSRAGSPGRSRRAALPWHCGHGFVELGTTTATSTLVTRPIMATVSTDRRAKRTNPAARTRTTRCSC